jgi:hypothetical protein
MATLVTQQISGSGLSPLYLPASTSGDKIIPDARTFLHVACAGASASVTVTVTDTMTAEPAGAASFDPNLQIVIEPGGGRFIGPINAERFMNQLGYADVSYDETYGVEVAAFRV